METTNKNFKKIVTFTDLVAWQEGHKLVLEVYKIINSFPPEERYCLSDQMRGAGVSITSNIAEGFTRFSSKEKSQFYRIAQASLTELQNQMISSKDLKYLTCLNFNVVIEQTVVVHKLITGLMKAPRLKKYE